MTKTMTMEQYRAETSRRIEQSIESFIEVTGAEGTPLRSRMLAIHAWTELGGRPGKPDLQAMGLYGLCYMTATSDDGPDTEQVFKRLYFRQAIDYCRHGIEQHEQVARLYDATMARLGLPTRFPWHEGNEVITIFESSIGTSFIPLSALVNEAIGAFMLWPEAGDADLDKQDREAALLVDLLGKHDGSPAHGKRIQRLLSCYAGKSGQMARLKAAVESMGIEPPSDTEATVRELEIEIGLRSATSPERRARRDRRRIRRH